MELNLFGFNFSANYLKATTEPFGAIKLSKSANALRHLD